MGAISCESHIFVQLILNHVNQGEQLFRSIENQMRILVLNINGTSEGVIKQNGLSCRNSAEKICRVIDEEIP